MNQSIGDLFVELTLKHDKIKTEIEKAQKEVKLAVEKGSKEAVIDASIKVDNLKKGLKESEVATKAAFEKMTTTSKTAFTTISEHGKKFTSDLVSSVGQMAVGFIGAQSAINLAGKAIQFVSATTKEALEGLDQQIQAESRLSVALGYNSKALLDYANATQLKTRYDDDAIIAAEAMLASFIKNEDQIKSVLPVVLDFAAASGQDLTSAATAVAKSIGGSDAAIARWGIQVEGAAGSTERINDLIDKMNERFKGQAEAVAKAGLGESDIAKRRIKEVYEAMANDLMPMVNQWHTAQANILETLYEHRRTLSSMAKIGLASIPGASLASNAYDLSRRLSGNGKKDELSAEEKEIERLNALKNILNRQIAENTQAANDAEVKALAKKISLGKELTAQEEIRVNFLKEFSESYSKQFETAEIYGKKAKGATEEQIKAEKDKLEIARKAREYFEQSLEEHADETTKQVQYEDRITKESLDRKNKYQEESLTAQQKMRLASIREQAEGFEQTAKNEKVSIDVRNAAAQTAYEKRIQLIKLEEQFALQSIAKQKEEALKIAASDDEKKAIEEWYKNEKQKIESDAGVKIRADIQSVVDIEVDKSSIRESSESFYAVTDLALRSLSGRAKNSFDEIAGLITTLAYNIGDAFGDVGSDIGGVVGMAINLFTTMMKPILNESDRIKAISANTEKVYINAEKAVNSFLKITNAIDTMAKAELKTKLSETFDQLAEFFNSTQVYNKSVSTGDQLASLYSLTSSYTEKQLSTLTESFRSGMSKEDAAKAAGIKTEDAVSIIGTLIKMARAGGLQPNQIASGQDIAQIFGRITGGNTSQRLRGSAYLPEYLSFGEQIGGLSNKIEGYDYGGTLDPFSIPATQGLTGFNSAKDILDFWKESGKISESQYRDNLKQISEKFKDYISPIDYQRYQSQQSVTLDDIYDQARTVQEQVSSGYLTYEAGSAKMQSLQDQAVSLATQTYGAGSYEAYRAKMEIVVKVDGSAVDENTARIIGETINEGIETYDMSRGGGSEV